METDTKEIYSEVYSILNLLGNDYINKLPKKLYEMIKSEKEESYNPQYIATKRLEEQNIKRESLSMIALFHLNYWCETEEEKNELKQIFADNEEKYQTELREKYNPDDIFKKPNEDILKEDEEIQNQMIEYKEESLFRKFINKIKAFFRR